MNYSVVVLCGGKGTRSGLNYNKMLYSFKDKTVYEMTMELFLNDKRCKQIIVVTKKEEVSELKKLIVSDKIEYIFGGKERQDSVYNGLQVVNQDYVLIHDGSRPYLKIENVNDLLKCLESNDACLLTVPVKDTIKIVNENNEVVDTPNRNTLWITQTPQCFKATMIKEAYQKMMALNAENITDDAMVMEQFGHAKVKFVEGDYKNIKVTTPEDISVVENFLQD